MAKSTITVPTKKHDNRVNVLGVGVDSTSRAEVLKKINDQCSVINTAKPLFIVTAYSEFILEAQKNSDFKQALDKSNLIIPDGVSLVAGSDYLKSPSKGLLADLLLGFKTGLNILQGKYSDQTVSGVELTRDVLELKHKIFLLGGWNGVAEKLANKYKCDFDEFDGHEELIFEKISKAKPDILLVALGHFRQEMWIAKNLSKLNCKVVMGVGSSFDEIVGEGVWSRPTPEWIKKMGLKWLWRVFVNPKHIVRAWNAFPVFAWKVFMAKLKKNS